MSENTVKTKKEKKTKTKLKKLVELIKKKPLYFLGILALLAGAVTLTGASAARGDCSANSIVKCGGFNPNSGSGPSQTNFNSNVSKYHNSDEVNRIFNHYGIDRSKLGSLPLGEVRRDGTIWVNGKRVATNAKSTGRQNISNANGSSRAVRISGGPTIYERSPAVSFKQNALQAWVKLDSNGKFMYAVITSCGNPTTGTPTYVPPPPPPPKPVGTVKCTNIGAVKVDRTRFRFTVSSSVTGSAKHKGFMISFGDGKNDGVETTANKRTFEHNYSQPGTYKIQAGAMGILDGKTIGDGGTECATSITVEKPPEQPKAPNYTIKKYVVANDAQTNNDAVPVRVNEEFQYKIIVKNTGEVKLSNVKVWDVLPDGVSYVNRTLKLNGSLVNNSADFFDANKGVVVPSIDVGSSAEFILNAIVLANASEVQEKCSKAGILYNNVAKADPEGTGPGLGEKNDPAVVKCSEVPKVKKPAVSIQKDVSKYDVEVNEEFTWSLRVINNGNVDLNNVRVADSAPDGVEFLSVNELEGVQTKIVNNKDFEATIAKLNVGEVRVFQIKSRVTKQVSGEIVNTACVDAPEVIDQSNDSTKDDCDDAKVRVTEEKCPVPGKESLPKNSAECGAEPCPIPGLEMYDGSDPLCRTAGVLTPAETPSTGNGIAVMAAVALAIGGGVYAYMFRGFKKA
jgi:uncharacterized repeat protein (TIGR01451 family)